MKILVDAHALSTPHKTGKHYYVISLLQAITKDMQANSYQFYLYSPQQLNLTSKLGSSVYLVRSPFSGPLYYLSLAYHLFTHHYDLLLSPTSFIPILLSPIKTITIIYDLAFNHPHEFKANTKASLLERILLPLVVRRSTGLIFLNRHLPQEISHYLSQKLPPFLCLPGIVRPLNLPSSSSPKFKHPYILYVGTIEPRKNLVNLIRAYHHFFTILKAHHRPVPKLYLAGKLGWYCEPLFTLVKKLNLTSHVKFLGYVPDQDLPKLYQQALFFTYLPFYEGFGLPLIEALSFNQAVIASSHPVIEDTLGPCGLTVDPHNIPQITRSLLQFYGSPDIKTQYQATIPNWLSQFAPQKTSQKFYQFLKTVLPESLPQTHLPVKPPPNS